MSNFNRPPMRGNCYPASQQPPQEIGNQGQCAALPALRAALYSAMCGGQNKVIRDQDRWVEKHAPNVKELKQEVRRLEIMCTPNQRHRAVRAGPYVPPGSVGPGFGFPFGQGWPW